MLRLIAERLLLGRRRYGELNLATDRRDFASEALEEAADMTVYAAAELLRRPGTNYCVDYGTQTGRELSINIEHQ